MSLLLTVHERPQAAWRGARRAWPVCGLSLVVASSAACSPDAPELVPTAWSSTTFEGPSMRPAIRDPLRQSTGWSHQSPSDSKPSEPSFVPRAGRPGVPDDATQALVVTTSHWKDPRGAMRRFERKDGASPWIPTAHPPVAVSVGRYGLAWGRGLHPEQVDGPMKFEGDHRSPAGVFDLGEARGYAAQPPEGTTWPFVHSGTKWRCMDNPKSQAYNTFISTQGMPLPPSVGIAPRETVFELMLFVMHNTSPVMRGAGSCVFLHVWAKPDHPTQGCVAMSRESIADLLPWIDLDRRPVLVELPAPIHHQHQEAWALPPVD